MKGEVGREEEEEEDGEEGSQEQELPLMLAVEMSLWQREEHHPPAVYATSLDTPREHAPTPNESLSLHHTCFGYLCIAKLCSMVCFFLKKIKI